MPRRRRRGRDDRQLPDTVGYTTPVEYAGLFAEMLEQCPELAGVELSVHCHNDLGLAVANSWPAWAAELTSQVECCKSTGSASGPATRRWRKFAMALRVRADAFDAESGIDPAVIREASALVGDLTGYSVSAGKPIVGANAFAHEAGIHQDGMLKDARTYQIMDPSDLGVMTLPLGKHSGRHAFARACVEAGHALDRTQVDAAFRRFKKLADLGLPVTLDDVFQEVHA